jgi:DNA repair exonuclease SbcCD ATPase subunit
MVARKDSLTSTASPTAAKAEPSLELVMLNLKRHYEEWKACNGHPQTYKQEELQKAEANLKTLKSRIPTIERTVQETQQQQVEAQEELNRMEILQKEIDASVKKARVNEGRHKPIKDQWYMGPKKHAQLAYEENNRCSKAWQKAMKDRADAQRIEMEAKQKIEEILGERKQLEMFGGYVAALPAASNSA